MKRLLAVIAATIALAIPTAAMAATTIESHTVYRTIPLCNGDLVDVTLPVHYVITETQTSSGGWLFNVLHSAQGVTALDEQTGTQYRGGGMTRWFQLTTASGESSQTFVNRFHLQALGGAQSLTVKVFETAHTQIAPDGSVKVDFDFAIERVGTC